MMHCSGKNKKLCLPEKLCLPFSDASSKILEAEALDSFLMMFCCSLYHSVFLCLTSFMLFSWVSWSMLRKLYWSNIAFVS